MNTKTFVTRIAALGIVIATTLLNAQSLKLTGKVPVDFTVGGKSVPAGSYEIAEQRAGIVVVRNDHGEHLAIAMLPVKTKETTEKNSLIFKATNGVYQLSSYCAANHGCWSLGETTAVEASLEVALLTHR